MSRFRPQYRELTPEEKAVVDEIKTNAEALEGSILKSPDGRYKALALTALEESVMWAVKGATG